jgi:hypothetical protein
MPVTRVKIEMNSEGARELLRSPEVAAELERRAQLIAAAAGPGFEVDARLGANRARASVRAATLEARKAEAEERTLTRALEAGRG